MSIASRKDVERIEESVFTVMRQGVRLQALFVLALPCVAGEILPLLSTQGQG